MRPFKKVRNIHFVGIGGAGMIGIARVLLQKGYKISGSDILDSYDLQRLRNDGAKVSIGHSKENIKNANLLVVSSAIDKNNPELIQAKKDSITTIPRAEMLGSLMIGYESVAVAGSHGKTTTTSMIAKIISAANLSPTYVVGGKILSTDENSDLGEGKYIVVEADESDGSFVHLQPDVAVLTNIDDDHLVHFNNIFENLLDSFVLFSENVPFYGYMVINGDDKNIKKISKRISRAQITFGESKNCDYQICHIKPFKGKQTFKIKDKKANKIHTFKINLPGKHNIYNAAASIGVALEEGIPITSIKKGISEFTGVGRRYEKHEIKIDSKKITLIDDYGHHPLEIDSNIKAYKEEYKNKKACMIFQPHRFSRTAQLFDDFIKVLKETDSLIMLDIYSASEKPIKGINSRAIVETLKQSGHKDVTYLSNHSDVNQLITQKKDSFDILVIQGAGNISKVCENIKDKWEI
mgnify:FL=1